MRCLGNHIYNYNINIKSMAAISKQEDFMQWLLYFVADTKDNDRYSKENKEYIPRFRSQNEDRRRSCRRQAKLRNTKQSQSRDALT